MTYLNEKLTYTKDGRLLDENGKSIMMDWEYPIMKKTAEVICRNGGRILNVGFGMGLIDNEIQKYNINEHWIIEIHPDVYKKMLIDGWHLKNNVKILFGDWRFFIEHLPKFDGIFIDTWGEELFEFHENVPKFLKSNGIYSFFNNTSFNKSNLKIREQDWEYLKKDFNYEIEELILDVVDDSQKQSKSGSIYWEPNYKKYYCPLLKLKK